MERRKFILRSFALTAGLGLLPPRVLGQATTLRFGLTPVFLSNDLKLLNDLKTYLETATGYEVELIQKRTYQEITTLLVAGQLDAAWICGYPFIEFRDALSLMSVPLWRGKPRYQAYLIGPAGRNASGIDDLRGDLHCFSDPNSNSGYLVTTSLLATRKARPSEFFKDFFFAYGHRNVVRAVAAKLAHSGSVDGYVWEVLKRVEPELTSKTKVVWKSDWLGFPPIAAPKTSAGSARFATIQNALLSMHADPLGKEILALLQLDSFGPPKESEFDEIARMVRQVRAYG